MEYYTQQSRSPYIRYDGYHVEEDRDVRYERQVQERERRRLAAKQRQHTLAAELSRRTIDEYQGDVVREMERLERLTLPDVNSIDIQTEIQWFMRPYLLDFLVEAHAAFALLPDTLYLAVNLLDRYCSKRVVYKRHYQLVGCAALLIASKYGDRKDRVPQIKELKAMCCSLYEEEMFTQMEWHLLQTLDWMVGHPTIDAFLQVAMSDSFYDREVEHMAWYVSELALFHKEFVSIPPSMMARSALTLARCILSKPTNDGYDPSLVERLYMQLQQPSPVVAKKYSDYHFSFVSAKADSFIEQERSRQLPPLTPPIDASMWICEKPVVGAANFPQTPQKMAYQTTMMSHGLYTPPITPENDNLGVPQYAVKHHGHLTPIAPDTPTPPAFIVDHQVRQCGMNYTAPPPQQQDISYYPM